MAIVEIQDLWKSFRNRRKVIEAVRGVNLTIREGEVFGFLGPNGAGKTTTLRMLTTLLPPDKGRATVAGFDLRNEPYRVRACIGYVSQNGGADSALTGRENTIMQARFYGFSAEKARKRVAELLENLEMTTFADRPARTYSGGQRRRLDLALGLVHQPRLLFLDEPSIGLDPQSRAVLWNEVRKLQATGTTIFLTTHYLDEADQLCDRLAIINLIVLVALPLGIHINLTGLLLTLGLVMILATCLSSCSYALAILLRDTNALSSFLNTLTLPALLLSGILLPLTLAPAIIRNIAFINPLAYTVNAARLLFRGIIVDGAVLAGFIIMVVLAALAIMWAVNSFKRAAA